MEITQGTATATFTPGEGYTSDEPSFALWLNSTFPGGQYADAAAHKRALLSYGLTVDGESYPKPAPEAPAEDAEDAEAAEPTPPINPHAYGALLPPADVAESIAAAHASAEAPIAGSVTMSVADGGSTRTAWNAPDPE